MWYGLAPLNAMRRRWSNLRVKMAYSFGSAARRSVKLHLGCGERHLEGYVNIDWRKTRATDLVCDIRRLPYPEESVNLIETYHVIEHMSKQDCEKALRHWHSLLRNGGRLIIECPNFDGAVREYLDGREERIHNIFGLQRFEGDAHRFGYNFRRLKEVLERVGFLSVVEAEPEDYHKEEEPCMRVECIKR